MNPRLVAISGPCEGRTFVLGAESFAIGRHRDNDLQLPRLDVSRHHCELRCHGGRFTLHDLDSRHGTFVNSRPISERRLEHSDLVTVGESALLLLLDDPSPSATVMPAAESFGPVAGTTIRRKPGDALYLDPRKVDAALPAQARIARDLNALLKISTALQGSPRVENMAERLLESIFEVVPAGRGAVLLREAGVKELTPAAVRDRAVPGGQAGKQAGFESSRTVINRVLRDGEGLLCRDLEHDPELGAAESVRAADVCSLLCVPLTGRDEVLGALYCDSVVGEAVFSERHLELLTAIAGIASPALENTYHLHGLERENRRLREETLRHDMVGESAPMQRLFELISRAARADSTILIRGESGTGKELVARALHRSSPRADAPFVAINCATLSDTLLESELFGHEKGAFTGAVARKIGKLESAHTGTVFLDEVGEIPTPLQAKLLRVLQERELERVGGSRPIPVDVRLLAATNRDLEAAIREGTFREDLYYRLKVITCVLPPLRDRHGDVPLLASHFAAVHGRHLGRRVGISPEARRLLSAYDWPGNVRELGNAVERAVVLGQDGVIRPEDLPDEVLDGSGDAPSSFQAALVATKKRLILDAYRQAGGDYGKAAEILGVHPNSLHRMIRNLGIKSQLAK